MDTAFLGGTKGKGVNSAHPNSTFPSHRYNESLLEEGKMMHRLRHQRVVKLLGVILEEGNYSLVMEYMERGNLMRVLTAEVLSLWHSVQAQRLGCCLSVVVIAWWGF